MQNNFFSRLQDALAPPKVGVFFDVLHLIPSAHHASTNSTVTTHFKVPQQELDQCYTTKQALLYVHNEAGNRYHRQEGHLSVLVIAIDPLRRRAHQRRHIWANAFYLPRTTKRNGTTRYTWETRNDKKNNEKLPKRTSIRL